MDLSFCNPGHCYQLFDLTSSLESDDGVLRDISSIFQNITLSGATLLHWDRSGIAFRADSEDVVFTYSTLSCSDFYSYHGRMVKQDCDAPILAISPIVYSSTGCDIPPASAKSAL